MPYINVVHAGVTTRTLGHRLLQLVEALATVTMQCSQTLWKSFGRYYGLFTRLSAAAANHLCAIDD